LRAVEEQTPAPPVAATEPPTPDDRSRARLPTRLARLDSLLPHPKNYRLHPDDQLEHIAASIRQHGLYRNVVVARGGVILAGHGVVQAAGRLGLAELPVVDVDLDPDDPRALKILTGDNEIERLKRMLREREAQERAAPEPGSPASSTSG